MANAASPWGLALLPPISTHRNHARLEKIGSQINHGSKNCCVEAECHQGMQCTDAAHLFRLEDDVGGLGCRANHKRKMHKIPIIRFFIAAAEIKATLMLL
jgi:hypothetical protein